MRVDATRSIFSKAHSAFRCPPIRSHVRSVLPKRIHAKQLLCASLPQRAGVDGEQSALHYFCRAVHPGLKTCVNSAEYGCDMMSQRGQAGDRSNGNQTDYQSVLDQILALILHRQRLQFESNSPEQSLHKGLPDVSCHWR